jgi:hypothetical protein
VNNLKQTLIKKLKRFPRMHHWMKEAAIFAFISRNRLRRMVGARHICADSNVWLQSVQTFDAPPAFRFSDIAELQATLTKHGIQYGNGNASVYLPPQPGLEQVLGELVGAYPPNSGFKILKRFSTPDKARYLGVAEGSEEQRAVGMLYTQAFSANALWMYGLGPLLYDIAHLRAGPIDLTVLVMQHAEGRFANDAEYSVVMQRFHEMVDRGVFALANPSGFASGDFRGPDCNENLITLPDGRTWYVDPQLFLFDVQLVLSEVVREGAETLHFGDRSRLVNGGRGFLYQEIPGVNYVARRATEQRAQIIRALLSAHSIELKNRVVFDVCCNSGMMLAQCLANGAAWGVGWDLPNVAKHAQAIMALIGAGRSTVIGCTLSEDYPLARDVPDWLQPKAQDAVLLFLAAWQHVGIPHDIANLPWRWLIFEGHGNDTDAKTREISETIAQRWNCHRVGESAVHDDMHQRKIFLFERNQAVQRT